MFAEEMVLQDNTRTFISDFSTLMCVLVPHRVCKSPAGTSHGDAGPLALARHTDERSKSAADTLSDNAARENRQTRRRDSCEFDMEKGWGILCSRDVAKKRE